MGTPFFARFLREGWETRMPAEGMLTTAQMVFIYNALNQRVRKAVGSAVTEYVFNVAGQRVSEWDGSTHTLLKGKYYWGAVPLAFYSGSAAHFEHQDWLGTERMRTQYNGAVEGTFTSLPFGDAQAILSGSDTDAYHFAGQDSDTETATDHAQFRQYSSAQGRWLSPDPYAGSYDFTSPQSFNRYSYVMNNPIADTDPTGLMTYLCANGERICGYTDSSGNGGFGGNFYEFDLMDIPVYGALDYGVYLNLHSYMGTTLLDSHLAADLYIVQIGWYVEKRTGLELLLTWLRVGQPTLHTRSDPNKGCTQCHVPNYQKPLSCDVDSCTVAQREAWCRAARETAALGVTYTGGGGTTPITLGIAGAAAHYTGMLDLWWLGIPAGVASSSANYVDKVCSQWGL